jgi:hypothetical protein
MSQLPDNIVSKRDLANQLSRNSNSFNQVSSATAQMKRNLSSLERSQIQSMGGMGGSLTSSAGRITGDATRALKNINNTMAAGQKIGAALSGKLEVAGVMNKVAQGLVSSSVDSIVKNKLPIHRGFDVPVTPLTDVNVRIPYKARKSVTEKMKNKTHKLIGRFDDNYASYQFPYDLQDNAVSQIVLFFFNYSRPNGQTPATKGANGQVYLPIPDNFLENFNIRYSPQDVGFTIGTVADGLTTVGKSDTPISTAMGKLAKMDVSAFAGGVGLQSIESADAAIGGIAGQLAGAIPNPHPSLFMKGVDLRQVEWSWKLVPRNPSDTRSLNNILRILKQKMLPQKSSGWLDYPDMVLPQVLGGNLEDVKFKLSMVSSMTINYTPEGGSAYFYDGQPVAVQLTIQLQEAEMFTRDDV